MSKTYLDELKEKSIQIPDTKHWIYLKRFPQSNSENYNFEKIWNKVSIPEYSKMFYLISMTETCINDILITFFSQIQNSPNSIAFNRGKSDLFKEKIITGLTLENKIGILEKLYKKINLTSKLGIKFSDHKKEFTGFYELRNVIAHSKILMDEDGKYYISHVTKKYKTFNFELQNFVSVMKVTLDKTLELSLKIEDALLDIGNNPYYDII